MICVRVATNHMSATPSSQPTRCGGRPSHTASRSRLLVSNAAPSVPRTPQPNVLSFVTTTQNLCKRGVGGSAVGGHVGAHPARNPLIEPAGRNASLRCPGSGKQRDRDYVQFVGSDKGDLCVKGCRDISRFDRFCRPEKAAFCAVVKRWPCCRIAATRIGCYDR
jgi:hypothetical protein